MNIEYIRAWLEHRMEFEASELFLPECAESAVPGETFDTGLLPYGRLEPKRSYDAYRIVL